jgi:hypothetical protein
MKFTLRNGAYDLTLTNFVEERLLEKLTVTQLAYYETGKTIAEFTRPRDFPISDLDKHCKQIGFDILAAITMKSTIICDVMLCDSAGVH